MKTFDLSFKKKFYNQLKISVLLTLLIFYLAYSIFDLSPNLTYSLLFGFSIGYIMQRSRICFTAVFRDPILFGMTELARAIVLSLIITSIGFFVLQYYQFNSGLEISGKFTPLGWHIPIGAFVFGLGASISGGCASGTLVRAGEGFHMQWVVIVSFIIGSVHGALHSDFWYSFFQIKKNVHLPTILNWEIGLIIQLIFLMIIYLLLYYHEKKKFPLSK